MLSNMEKIEMLIKYVGNDLAKSEKQLIKSVIKTDPEAANLLTVIKTLYKVGNKTDWTQIKASVIALSSSMFEDYQKSRKKGKAKRGVTIYDSRILPLPDGVRPAVVDCRRLKYKINGLDLEISLYPVSTDSYEIIGQLSGIEHETQLEIKLRSKNTKFSAKTDKYQLFRFDRVPIMDYQFSIHSKENHLGTVEIEL